MSPLRFLIAISAIASLPLAVLPRQAVGATPVGDPAHDQNNPQLAADGTGGVVVAWEDYRTGTGDIYARALDGNGTPRWPAVAVCAESNQQQSPKVVTDGAGGAIVCWHDFRSGTSYDIYVQHVLASGVVDPAWPPGGRALCTLARDQSFPMIVADGTGGAIVTWQDNRDSDLDIYAQHVLASGAVDPAWPAGGRAACAATNHQRSPTMVADGAGGAIVCWYDARGASFDIYAQHVLASGAVDAVWPEDGRALCTNAASQMGPTIVTDGSGGAIVAWLDYRTGKTSDIYVQHVLGSGAVDATWPADGQAVCTAINDQLEARLLSDGAGGAIVGWQDRRDASTQIYAHHVLASGVVNPAWPADGRALSAAAGDKFAPTIVGDGAGGAMVAWQDYRGGLPDIYAQHVLPSGALDPTWPADGLALCDASGTQFSPAIASDGRGGAIVAWTDYRDPLGMIYAARVAPSGPQATVWPDDGVGICIGSGAQDEAIIASDGAGGAIVAWVESRDDGSVDIYAQHVQASGTVDPGWPAGGRALCTAANIQSSPAIVSDGAGGAIVTWYDGRNGTDTDIYAQHVLASGTVDPAWPADGRALCTAGSDQYYPTIVSDGSGGAIITWQDRRSGTSMEIYAQHVLASGAVDLVWPANGCLLCTAADDRGSQKLVSDGAGGAIVTWNDRRSGTSYDIYAQRVLASGTVDPAWPADGRGLCLTTNDQTDPTITADGLGGAIVCWHDRRSGTNHDVYAQRVLASGAVAAGWPVNGLALCTAAGSQLSPKIVSDGAGGAIATWSDRRNGNDFDIYAQRVLASGAIAADWPADGLALCTATDDQETPTIAADGAGGAIVTWADRRSGVVDDIYAQRILASGVVDAAWPAGGHGLCTDTGTQGTPEIVADGAGGAVVAWLDIRSGTDWDVYAQRIAITGPPATVWAPDGVTSTQLSLESAQATPGAVRLAWYTSEVGLEATLYRSDDRGPWSSLATLGPDGTGRMQYVDETVAPGRHYGYRLGVRSNGAEEFLGEVWLTTPNRTELRLEGLRPNPAVRDLVVTFSLSGAGDASLELVDVNGRRVLSRRLTGLSAGSHVVNLGAGAQLAPGLYVMRLTEGKRVATRKAVVAR